MIREELKELKTGPQELRKFGITVGGVFGLLALWFWWRHKPFYPFLLIPAAPLLVLGLIYPKTLRGVYLAWMSLALVLGLIVSTVVLTLFFYLIVTPIGLLARLLGNDFLNRKWDRQAASYWIPRDRSAPRQNRDYEQQF